MSERPKWLDNAVFYEVYPQSFKDTDGDGIGNINGITEKLPYIKGLGCTAVWINPCFESPFGDAGYDVSDYCKAAPRYGTNDDLINFVSALYGQNPKATYLPIFIKSVTSKVMLFFFSEG